METKYTVNAVPSLTWNWLKSNNDIIEISGTFEVAQAKIDSIPGGVTLSAQGPITSLPQTETAILNIPNTKFGDKAVTPQNARITTAAKTAKEEISAIIESTAKNQYLTIEGKTAEPVVLVIDTKGNTVSQQIIHAKENSEATVILLFKSDDEAATQIVTTKVYAEAYAKLHVIKVQLLSEKTLQLDDTQFSEGDNAFVKFSQIELGGQHVASGLHSDLHGYQASFESEVAYLCQKNQCFDMNHMVYHYGKKTECNMQVNGTLKDNAVKAYRGTIDFKKGCCGSKGNEMEETLILSPTAVNKSLPIILCDEEDVEGEHGATIGKLSSDILFYMESRGIDEKEAEQIMARAKIQAVADAIPQEDIKNLVIEYLEKNI